MKKQIFVLLIIVAVFLTQFVSDVSAHDPENRGYHRGGQREVKVRRYSGERRGSYTRYEIYNYPTRGYYGRGYGLSIPGFRIIKERRSDSEEIWEDDDCSGNRSRPTYRGRYRR